MEEPALPRPKRGDLLVDLGREDLDLYGVAELRERIDALQAEIDRVQRRLDAKQSGRAAADALFGGLPT
jgi:uncharacterized small protein (DUF1192 family)